MLPMDCRDNFFEADDDSVVDIAVICALSHFLLLPEADLLIT